MSRSNTPEGRRLVLCFDGTSEQFSATNTNVVRLFASLDPTQPDKQLIYYQPGIGTYVPPTLGLSKVLTFTAKLLDQAFAWYLDAHIMEGYRFLMENYRKGDKIYMFGFSRGSYTARCLAGMLDKVGLLTKGNEQQIQFAYQKYKGTSDSGLIEAQGFKETFGQHVEVEFLGVWDTVASVGVVVARNLPFSSSNKIIKTFRHGLSLDEHRVRFLPNPWHLPTPQDDEYQTFTLEEGHWSTDVKEVWFAGGHGDIGGGNYSNDISQNVSDLSFQWMISEIISTRCGILFKPNAFHNIPAFKVTKAPPLPPRPASSLQVTGPNYSQPSSDSGSNILSVTNEDMLTDATQPIWDSLARLSTGWWWILEILPMEQKWQDANGRWHSIWALHLGAPRKISEPNPTFHESVRLRELNVRGYRPKARFTGTPVYAG